VRREIAYYLSREIGVTMEEIVRNIGVGTSAVAMTLKQKEAEE
jgi:predicted transcriptional regulator